MVLLLCLLPWRRQVYLLVVHVIPLLEPIQQSVEVVGALLERRSVSFFLAVIVPAGTVLFVGLVPVHLPHIY